MPSEQHPIEAGQHYRSQKLLVEVLEPYTNHLGLAFAKCRVLESDGFVDVSESDLQCNFSADVLTNSFKRVDE
jgi:hypothetical protein